MLKKLLTTVVILISVGVGVTFAAKNPQAVSVSYYFNLAWEGPLVIALIATLASGAFLGAAPLLLRIFQLKRKLNAACPADSAGGRVAHLAEMSEDVRKDR
jgi:uncharacterized integral membrane protein